MMSWSRFEKRQMYRNRLLSIAADDSTGPSPAIPPLLKSRGEGLFSIAFVLERALALPSRRLTSAQDGRPEWQTLRSSLGRAAAAVSPPFQATVAPRAS